MDHTQQDFGEKTERCYLRLPMGERKAVEMSRDMGTPFDWQGVQFVAERVEDAGSALHVQAFLLPVPSVCQFAALEATDHWKPIDECPTDHDRLGGVRTWRLRCMRPVEIGKVYSFRGAADVSAPYETKGRRTSFNDTGWVEIGTGRQLRPVSFALAPEARDVI